MLILLNCGITFSVITHSLPELLKISSSSYDALLLPAAMIAKLRFMSHKRLALTSITSLLPPSVPPHSNTRSGLMSYISCCSACDISNAYVFTTFAPALDAAIFAAFAVSSGTSPSATIFSPPAALLQQRSLSYLNSPIAVSNFCRALRSPSITSVSMVVKAAAVPTTLHDTESMAVTFVYVLPKSTVR